MKKLCRLSGKPKFRSHESALTRAGRIMLINPRRDYRPRRGHRFFLLRFFREAPGLQSFRR